MLPEFMVVRNPTPQHLKLLLKIALRQELDHLNAGDNYAIGDTESEDSRPESDHESVSKATESQQTKDIDSMLAEIDVMLTEIQK
ncbi:hypothetical protein C1646_768946 [Rhizophagus diaphanus]|nr:hypothetical protein C1646_768946 [Rhizophagus diaphanus] [Rhizophagus sp. MUCL 43196]